MATETSVERMEAEANRTPHQLVISFVLILAGVCLVITTAVIWVVLADKAADYYAYDMGVRDLAAAGSELLADQSTIEAYPGWLRPLPFLGMAFVLLGITSLFGAIIPKLRLVMTVMATVLPPLRDRQAG